MVAAAMSFMAVMTLCSGSSSSSISGMLINFPFFLSLFFVYSHFFCFALVRFPSWKYAG